MNNNESSVIKIIPYLLLMIGLIIFIFFFFEAAYTMYENVLGFSSGKIRSYSGLNLAFGKLNQDNTSNTFNILVLFAYILPLIAGLLAILTTKEYETVKYFAIGITYTISCILLFALISYVNVSSPIGQTLKLGLYPIIGGCLSLISTVLSFYYTLRIKK